MKREKRRWVLIAAAGLLAIFCSIVLISIPIMRNSFQELDDSITASSKMLQQMLPEINGNEHLYREIQEEMNIAVLTGFACQLEAEEEITAEEFETKCARYGVKDGFLSAPDGQVLISTDEDTAARYEASLREDGSGNSLFYSETLPDKRILVLEFSDEELDMLIDYSVAWVNRIQRIRIGQTGFACVLSQEGNIISHPEDRLLLDETAYFDLKNPMLQSGKLALYNLETQNISDRYYYSMFGRLIPFGDYQILCGVTLPEFFKNGFSGGMVFPLLLGIVLYVIIRYLFLLRTATRKNILRRLSVAALLGLILTFSFSLFLQAISQTALQMSAVDTHAKNAVDALERNDEISQYMSRWFENEQLKKCRLAADILCGERDTLSRGDVREISGMLGVTWCFLYDRNGNVVLTDSPYDHFSLSRREGSQSAAFLPLLEGVESLIQNPMPDDVSGKEMQYVGVSVRNERDLADGFVQIAVDRTRYGEMIDALGIRQEIENIGVNESEFAFALETDSGIIRYATDPDLVGSIIPTEAYESVGSSYNGYIKFSDGEYIGGIQRAGSYIIAAMRAKQPVTGAMLRVSLILSGILLAALAVFAVLLPQKSNQGETDGQIYPNTEEKLRAILQRVLFIICLLLTVQYFASFYSSQKYPHSGTALIEFIMNGDWEREPNLFSVSYSLFVAAFAAASFGLVSRVLNQLAEIGSPHVQTLCYLIKNVLKYSCVLVVLYYCLAQFGVDTRTLLASAGIMSLVIGLGAKDLITDILAGLFIIFERTFEVGDFVTIDNFNGIVQEIGLRTTKVAFQSNVKIFNNADIRKVVNRKGSKQNIVVELGIALDESLKHVEDVFNRDLPALKDIIPGALSAPVCSGVSEITDRIWKLRIILESDASKQAAARAELLRQLKLIAERNGICLAGKQLDIVKIEDPGDGERF